MIRIGLADIALSRGHTFVATQICQSSVIIDAGAHRLEFSSDLVERFDCSSIAIEPNPGLALSPKNSKIRLVTAALSDKLGRAAFEIRDNLESSSLAPEIGAGRLSGRKIDVDKITLSAIVREFGVDSIDLLKLDIEGAEYDVLFGLDEALSEKIRQITVEFHPQISRDDEMHRYRDVLTHLSALGFASVKASFSGIGDVIFLNTRFFEPPGSLTKVVLQVYRKYLEWRSRHQ
jgi:FkbM family methyltransferase